MEAEGATGVWWSGGRVAEGEGEDAFGCVSERFWEVVGSLHSDHVFKRKLRPLLPMVFQGRRNIDGDLMKAITRCQ